MMNRRRFGTLLLGAFAMPAFGAPYFIRFTAAGNDHDVVAYFTQSKPVMGNLEISTEWDGAKWLFSSKENRDLFVADPTSYAPQYGGHCAFAMSKGAKASSIPEAWNVVDGKLYMNYSLPVRDLWRQDIPGNIEKADVHWQKYREK